ncbi:hypothetical protein N7471_010582 [Penicillium samsonianum]|uniref:uncharacterized protein n=1 Tax=Penicillium samsonianum TaxID=1882272 RepID=UPI0025487D41|nr:uncharacterized protein N7471_010582 [Penicillium samsonianum]KAJ6126089.1 hypothetical protein N7471_010582 [Penicillium samsonianum]
METPGATKSETYQVSDDESVHSSRVEMGIFISPQHDERIPQYCNIDPSALAVTNATYNMPISPPYASMPSLTPLQSWPTMPPHQSPSHEMRLSSGLIPPFALSSSLTPSVLETSTGRLIRCRKLTVEDRRQKKEHHKCDDRSRYPVTQTIGRVPNIKKALFNWAKNCRRKGLPLNDDIIMDRALSWANDCRLPEAKMTELNKQWLEKFNQETNLFFVQDSDHANTEEPHPSRISESLLKVGTKEACTALEENDPASVINQQCNKTMHSPPASRNSKIVSHTSACGCCDKDEIRYAMDLVVRYFQHQHAGLSSEEHKIIGGIMKRLEHGHGGLAA